MCCTWCCCWYSPCWAACCSVRWATGSPPLLACINPTPCACASSAACSAVSCIPNKEQELHSGDVTSRLVKDIETISSVCTDTVPQIAITFIQLCGAFLLMRWFDARLAWALLLLTPMAIVFGKLISRRLRKMTLDIREDESRIQMQVQESMEHNAVLRSLG